MLADVGDTFFPYNAVEVVEAFLMQIDSDITFLRRKIQVVDPDQSIGIAPARWYPHAQGVEMGHQEPSIQVYEVMIQTLIVDSDEARGLRMHSYFAKRVRELLARDQSFRVALSSLSTTDSRGVIESLLRYKTEDQIFHNAAINGNWQFLSTLQLTLETQIR